MEQDPMNNAQISYAPKAWLIFYPDSYLSTKAPQEGMWPPQGNGKHFSRRPPGPHRIAS